MNLLRVDIRKERTCPSSHATGRTRRPWRPRQKRPIRPVCPGRADLPAGAGPVWPSERRTPSRCDARRASRHPAAPPTRLTSNERLRARAACEHSGIPERIGDDRLAPEEEQVEARWTITVQDKVLQPADHRKRRDLPHHCERSRFRMALAVWRSR